VVPFVTRNSRSSSPSSRTGTGLSGTAGAVIFSIGERDTSPSSTHQFQNTWRPPYRVLAVEALRTSRR